MSKTEIVLKMGYLDFLDKISNFTTEIDKAIALFGEKKKIIEEALNYLLENDIEENKREIYFEVIGILIFDNSDNRTYREDWEEYNYLLKKVPNDILIDWLYTYKPGKHREEASELALDWFLNNKFEGELTLENSKILLEIFEEYDEQDIPEKLETFKKKNHFVNELNLFQDLNFLEENYTKFSFDKKEILEILKYITLERKINNFDGMATFINLIKWYAPSKNPFGPDYRKEFILEILNTLPEDGIQSWSDEALEFIKDSFYDIDFENDDLEFIKMNNKLIIQNEADHISKMLKINPNYRHD